MRAMMRGIVLLALAGLLVLPAALAGDPEPSRTEMFEAAREAAWAGQRDHAQEICLRILERYPDDHDTRILLGRIHAWEKRFDEARRELNAVLTANPLHLDARLALIDAELWDGRSDEALRLCDEGLEQYPDEAELLDRQRKVRHLQADRTKNQLSVWYRYEDFDQDLDPWHETGLQFAHKMGWGDLIGRVTHVKRFDDSGQQFEVDAYPKLPNRFYFYLNAGYSGSELFPEYRYGAELYKNFNGGWEASAGLFRMHFENSTATLYTGSLGKYWKSWWFSLRPTLSDWESDDSLSWRVSSRRYFGDPEDYVGFSVGGGDRLEQSFFTGVENQLNSGRFQLEAQRRITDRWIAQASAGMNEQEFLVADPGESWFVRAGMEWWF